MTRRNIIVLLVIGLIVAGTVFWIVYHWAYYLRILAGLWPLLVGFLVTVAALLEVVWWLRFDRWYYQSGPTVRCEQWQTSGSNDQVREAIRPVLNTKGWAGRESPEGFLIRRRGFWKRYGSRVCLRLEDTDQGALIRYEVRPLWTMPLWIIAAAALFFSPFRVFFFTPATSWFVTPCFCLLAVYAVAYYVWPAPYEAKRMARVKHIRRALAGYRLGVCEKCGYDLFGHSRKHVCPECGTQCESLNPQSPIVNRTER